MRVLLAGGAGFIGSHISEELLHRGAEVVCLDNLSTGSIENIECLASHHGFEYINCSVEDAPEMTGVDLVMHFASPASPIHYGRHPIQTMMANSDGTKRLLDIAQRNNARFFFASTSEVYGEPQEHPQAEEYWGNVNPNGVRACYDESKRFGEALTMTYHRHCGVNAGIVRIFNTYGPRMSPEDGRAIPAFIGAALQGLRLPVFGDGLQTRSFCYVSDLVRGLLAVACDRSANGEVFNVGNPEEVTVLEVAETIQAATGGGPGVFHLPRPQDDPSRRRPDIRRIQERYGWRPEVGLQEGLCRTIEYFRSSRPQVEAAS